MLEVPMVPGDRVSALTTFPIAPERDFVLYWMVAHRRPTWNFALERAAEWSAQLHKPVLVLEALRCDYRWASDRLHHFVLDGMSDHLAHFRRQGITYYPYVERLVGEGKGLLAELAKHACVVVTDDYPCFMLPRMLKSAAEQVCVHMEMVDANGLLPMRASPQVFPTAYAYRRFVQRQIPAHLSRAPAPDPMTLATGFGPARVPKEVGRRWPSTERELVETNADWCRDLPIDHSVEPTATRGGFVAARATLDRFLNDRIHRYADDRNDPDADVTSELSPYLHFGHLSIHEVFTEVAREEEWDRRHLAPKATGSRTGWWGMSPGTEAFLDQCIVWRELGFNLCALRSDYDRYDSLPAWARRTLGLHAADPRSHLYSLEEFETSQTHDPLWNAAQNQLRREGRIHNYLRMLWGKKILEWTRSPGESLEFMIHLNNKYALDGRDPNSYSGIFWILGRYDRPWGPERPVFGTIRYMSSANTAKKVNVDNYLERYAKA